MNSSEINKAVASVLVAGITFMVAGIIGDALVHPKRLQAPAIHIEGVQQAERATPAGPPPAAVIPSVLPLLAGANVEDGQGIARRVCAACHTFDQGGRALVGPNLYGIVGASHAHAEGFNYSAAIAGMKGKPWTYEELNHFLFKPSAYAPGTRMGYAGLSNLQQRADLIAYLRTLAPDPRPLPTPDEIEAAKAGAGGGTAAPSTPSAAPAAAAPAAPAAPAAGPAPTSAPAAPPAAAEPAPAAPAAAPAPVAPAPAAAPAGPAQQGSAPAGDDLAKRLAAADPAAGESVFKRVCAACHTANEGGQARIGPNLYGVVGREHSSFPGFSYSPALKAKTGPWTFADLDAWLANPARYAPGNRMGVGVPNAKQRADVIVYLRSLSHDPVPLPTP